jgi:RNA 2',3'-cyclic 3'-phosphodiesterase
MPRLFSAIELPDDIRNELRQLHMPLPNARWLSPPDYHLTLRFAGDIDNALAREFSANLAEIDFDAFSIRLSGLGAFGGNDPHNVWVGVEPSHELEVLARAHEKAARNAGLPPEKRLFKPHVTLARLKYSSAEAVARFFTRFGGYRSEPFYVSEFVLMSSKPSTGGGPYGVVESFSLRGGVFAADEDGAFR